jgi:hypothetical protein
MVARSGSDDSKVEKDKPGGLKVIAPLVSVRFGDKVLQYSFGDVLPAGVSEDSIKHLKELGFVESV